MTAWKELAPSFESAAGAEPFDVACGPGFWKRGQESNFTGVGLKQHFRDGGRGAEGAFHLGSRETHGK